MIIFTIVLPILEEKYDTIEYSKVKCYSSDFVHLQNIYSIGHKKRQQSLSDNEIFLSLANGTLARAPICTKGVAMSALIPMLLLLALEVVGVGGDDGDQAPVVGADVVGREGEESLLASKLLP